MALEWASEPCMRPVCRTVLSMAILSWRRMCMIQNNDAGERVAICMNLFCVLWRRACALLWLCTCLVSPMSLVPP